MKSLANLLRLLWAFFDALILLISPLAMIMIVVGVIILLDRGGEHFRFVHKMEQEGLVTIATIEDDPSNDGWWYVRFDDPSQVEERTGFIDDQYYTSEVKASLQRGAQVKIRYLPQAYENFFVLEEHFDQVQRYWGFASDIGIALLISWLMVAFHPEFLYLGYEVPFSEAIGKRIASLSSNRGVQR